MLNDVNHNIPSSLSRLRAASGRLEAALFGLSMGFYVITRLVGLDRFPIYFFTDEAVQTVLASDFIRDGLRDSAGTLFPTYFQNTFVYNLSLSVYLQVIPYIILGRSVLVTRATAMLVTAVGAFGLGLILKSIYRVRYWWAGVLFLSITPVWFLHSRTAFETTLMVSMYIWFIYFYLLYRTRSPRYLYACLIFGALVFYSYSPGQLIVFASGILLFLSDLRYHWQNRRTAGRGLIVIAVLFLPYLRFQLTHPGETASHLRVLDSYIVQDIPLTEKVAIFAGNYVRGLNPAYWYLPNPIDLMRHTMKGYGHILAATFPLALIGLIIVVRRIRETEYRALLVALLASPFGMALVALGVTRALLFVFPAALLTTLGVEPIGRRLSRVLPGNVISVFLFVVLSGTNVYMMKDSLNNGPTWFTTYGLYGMQYGAQQVYGEVRKEVERSRETLVFVSPNWANGVDVLQRFFLQDEDPVWMLDFDALQSSKVGHIDKMLFVLTPPEYDALVDDPKFEDIRVEETIPYPDGSTGFYFVRTAYSPEADALLAAERAEMLRPVTDEFYLEGELLKVVHPAFDIGEVEDMFDGDPQTLVRSREVNPAVIGLSFEHPRSVKGIQITTGTMDMRIVIRFFAGETAEPDEYSHSFFNLPEDPTVTFDFPNAPPKLTRIEISIEDLNADSRGNIHIREITLE
jgi:4-amino-4-deoxy-L-arabinose transferase-like glycosyltransferase